MPTETDPAPRGEGVKLYECRSCLMRVRSRERIIECPDCDGKMENLTKPRPE